MDIFNNLIQIKWKNIIKYNRNNENDDWTDINYPYKIRKSSKLFSWKNDKYISEKDLYKIRININDIIRSMLGWYRNKTIENENTILDITIYILQKYINCFFSKNNDKIFIYLLDNNRLLIKHDEMNILKFGKFSYINYENNIDDDYILADFDKVTLLENKNIINYLFIIMITKQQIIDFTLTIFRTNILLKAQLIF